MEAQLNEANTFPSQSYAQSFFTKLPTDNRFLQKTFVPIPLKSSLKGKTITFVGEKFQAANIYMIQDAHIEIRMVITKENGEIPEKAKMVAPRNNIIHTVFESCRLYLNDVLFSTNSTHYHYKSYICTALTFPTTVKANQLQAGGWVADINGLFNDCTANTGFIQRNNMFRIKRLPTNDYRKSGAGFIGRLFHDLVACESGIPPNISIKIELDKAPASFVLQCPATDNELYDYKITNAALYIPVGQLSLSVYSELGNLMARTSEGSVSIHYRRLEIRPILLSKGNQDHYFKPLLSDAECPCKLVICFVESDAKSGSYHKNPFEFGRSWQYETQGVESLMEAEEYNDKMNTMKNIQKNIQEAQHHLENFATNFFKKAEDLMKFKNLLHDKEPALMENESLTAKPTSSNKKNDPPEDLELHGAVGNEVDLSIKKRTRNVSICSEFATASNAPSSEPEFVGRSGFSHDTLAATVVQYITGITLTLNSSAVDLVIFIFLTVLMTYYNENILF